MSRAGRGGEAVFRWGASGRGKTALLYTLAGLERPEAGEVEVQGHQLYRNGESALAKLRNEKMGFVFQGYFLLPELTALENVMLPGMIGGRATRVACTKSLDDVGLGARVAGVWRGVVSGLARVPPSRRDLPPRGESWGWCLPVPRGRARGRNGSVSQSHASDRVSCRLITSILVVSLGDR